MAAARKSPTNLPGRQMDSLAERHSVFDSILASRRIDLAPVVSFGAGRKSLRNRFPARYLAVYSRLVGGGSIIPVAQAMEKTWRKRSSVHPRKLSARNGLLVLLSMKISCLSLKPENEKPQTRDITRRNVRGRFATIALIGVDGSGKTTVAKALLETCPLPLKYVYMGTSIESSNAALPTSRLIHKLKVYQHKN